MHTLPSGRAVWILGWMKDMRQVDVERIREWATVPVESGPDPLRWCAGLALKASA